jgi:hypothetical protein
LARNNFLHSLLYFATEIDNFDCGIAADDVGGALYFFIVHDLPLVGFCLQIL